MDTTDPDIFFDESGICNHCKEAEERLRKPPLGLSAGQKAEALQSIIRKIKERNRNKKYDCVIGLSGGVDSTFVAYKVIGLGLKPLAVHLDNGWNSEIAEDNIKNILEKLEIDLVTQIADWEEFKNLEIAFLKASTPDLEISSDHAIVSLLYYYAAKENLKYIINGVNTNSESILPSAWSRGHNDWRYIRLINKKFSGYTLKTIPHRSFLNSKYDKYIKKIEWLSILDYLDYNKFEAKKIIQKELNWKDYGGKHYESIITKFWQGYILPTKFGFDKRRAHLSSLIVAGQISREQALEELKLPAYPPEDIEKDIKFFCEKLGISLEEFEIIMKTPAKTFWDYPSYEKSWYYKVLKAMRNTKKAF